MQMQSTNFPPAQPPFGAMGFGDKRPPFAPGVMGQQPNYPMFPNMPMGAMGGMGAMGAMAECQAWLECSLLLCRWAYSLKAGRTKSRRPSSLRASSSMTSRNA